jgi:hypothetical protein
MRHPGRKGARTDGKLFTMWLSIDERADLEIRASANDISAAEYVRRALAAVAAVGGSEEFLLRKTKGKKK